MVKSLQAVQLLSPKESEAFGEKLGASLSVSLFTCANAQAAVDEWFMQNEVLREMSDDHEWFIPLIIQMGHELLLKAPWGLRGKVGLIFVLHYTNILLDLYLIVINLSQRPTTDGDLATAINSTVVDNDNHSDSECEVLMDPFTLGLVMLLTYIVQVCMKLSLDSAQHLDLSRSEGEKCMSYMKTVLCAKPIIDVKDIIADEGKGAGNVFEPTMEFMAEKQLDLCFGDIPMIFCQLSNLLALLGSSCGGNDTQITLLITSISMSLLLVGYNQASLAYFGDTDPQLRMKVPSFYGLIADNVIKR